MIRVVSTDGMEMKMVWANRKRRKYTNEKWIIGRKNGRIDKLLIRIVDKLLSRIVDRWKMEKNCYIKSWTDGQKKID